MGAAFYITTENGSREFATLIDGKALCRLAEDLDRIAERVKVNVITSFVSVSAEEIAELLGEGFGEAGGSVEQWFAPEAGIVTVNALIDHIRGNPGSIDEQDLVLMDLESLRQALVLAMEQGVRWRLAIDI